MMRSILLALLLCVSWSACVKNQAAQNCSDAWTAPTTFSSFPQGRGVNIHFTDPQPGEIKMIADAGFRWVRMDFKWDLTEQRRGVYDFSPYDRLITELDRYGVSALFILDYGNPLYTGDKPPRTKQDQDAFAKWAVAAAKHFANHGILWEVYNEPNHKLFWPPKPRADEYVGLALTVGRAFRTEVPNEKLIAPATAGVDFPFLDSCFRAGLLDYWLGVSVHPYRQENPETVADDFCSLRQMIQSYNSNKPEVPIISGEWGYSAAWPGFSEQSQSEMLAREFLSNAANRIPLSIWYDWRDDGPDPTEPEHHFGIVRYPYLGGAEQPYEPKPAYYAATTVNNFLQDQTFEQRLPTGDSSDFVLVFSAAGVPRTAAWTTSTSSRQVLVAIPPGSYTITKLSGEKLRDVFVGRGGQLAIDLSTSPVFIWPML